MPYPNALRWQIYVFIITNNESSAQNVSISFRFVRNNVIEHRYLLSELLRIVSVRKSKGNVLISRAESTNRSGGWEGTNRLYEGNGARDGREGPFVRRKRSGGWEGTEHLYEGNGTEDGRERSICTKEKERGIGGSGAFVRRYRSVCMVRSEKTL